MLSLVIVVSIGNRNPNLILSDEKENLIYMLNNYLYWKLITKNKEHLKPRACNDNVVWSMIMPIMNIYKIYCVLSKVRKALPENSWHHIPSLNVGDTLLELLYPEYKLKKCFSISTGALFVSGHVPPFSDIHKSEVEFQIHENSATGAVMTGQCRIMKRKRGLSAQCTNKMFLFSCHIWVF